jgi:hypothetical protein
VSHRYQNILLFRYAVRRRPARKSRPLVSAPFRDSTPPILIGTVSAAPGGQKRGVSGTDIFIVLYCCTFLS